MLGALVVVLDYAFKFMGIKIPFPLFPMMRFDMDGVPIVLALFFYGSYSASATCMVAFVAILARSGAVLSASMKALAEFGTILGMIPFYKTSSPRSQSLGIISGILTRVVIMVLANLAASPLLFKSIQAAIAFTPFISLFNIIAGMISITGGYIVYKALAKRASHLLPNNDTENT
jgi:riboflavin transporter FmnP